MRGIQTNNQRIRQLRRKLGMTQEQLAAAADCDVKTLRKAESSNGGGLDLRVLLALAIALGVEVNSLAVDQPAPDPQVLLGLVQQWTEAIYAADIERILDLHTEDTVLEIPGAVDLPGAGTFRGKEELRRHFNEVEKLFRLEGISDAGTAIHVVDCVVFMRTVATFRFIPAQLSYTTTHINEFQFRGDKIARRIVVADYEGLRQLLKDSQWPI